MHSFKVYPDLPIERKGHVWRVIDGIAASRKMIVVCGAGVSVAAGIEVCAWLNAVYFRLKCEL